MFRGLPCAAGVPNCEVLNARDKRDADRLRYQRWEAIREMAERVLRIHLVLTPDSEGLHIRAMKPNACGDQMASVSRFVLRHEIDDAVIDTVSITMLHMIKELGGFDAI